MYTMISKLLAQPYQEKRFIGDRTACRFCGTSNLSAFGKPTNAHTFPTALGNRTLFSLDECKSCNERFSIYEDSLSKAIGPFLTLGGVRGRKGVRKTGRTGAVSTIRHSTNDGHRQLSITSAGSPDDLISANTNTGLLRISIPIDGDKYVPRYAYKALLKMAVALLPNDELSKFSRVINCLKTVDEIPHLGPMQVGFSFAMVGNAPPSLAGVLMRRKDENVQIPYLIFIFVAGSVCFQIWVRSDDMDEHVPSVGALNIEWTSQLRKPEGGYHPIRYGRPMQFDWVDKSLTFQPFSSVELMFNPHTTEATFTPKLRKLPK